MWPQTPQYGLTHPLVPLPMALVSEWVFTFVRWAGFGYTHCSISVSATRGTWQKLHRQLQYQNLYTSAQCARLQQIHVNLHKSFTELGVFGWCSVRIPVGTPPKLADDFRGSFLSDECWDSSSITAKIVSFQVLSNSFMILHSTLNSLRYCTCQNKPLK
jgi:hypothetical protein